MPFLSERMIVFKKSSGQCISVFLLKIEKKFSSCNLSLLFNLMSLLLWAGNPHVCQQKCHIGPCGECDGVTELTCVCGAVHKEFPCHDLVKFSGRSHSCGFAWHSNACSVIFDCFEGEKSSWIQVLPWLFTPFFSFLSVSVLACIGLFPADQPFKCEKRCNKKKMCGRHKCNETCCVVRYFWVNSVFIKYSTLF